LTHFLGCLGKPRRGDIIIENVSVNGQKPRRGDIKFITKQASFWFDIFYPLVIDGKF